MTKTTLALLVGLLLAAPAVAAEDAGVKWYDDFDKAVTAAKAEGKDLFVHFTGSDWCGWCVRLHKEIYEHEEFQSGVKDKYILVSLDYPRDPEVKAKVPNPARNDELRIQYAIRGYPTVLLMNADGEVYAQTGYQRGGPAAYVAHLEEISAAGKKSLVEARVLVKAYEEAADAEKTAAIEKAAEALTGMKPGQPAGRILVPVVQAGLTADPENKAGLKLKVVEALMANDSADDAVFAAAEALDSRNEKGLLEKVVMSKFGQTRSNDIEALKALLATVDAFEKLGAEKDKNLCMGIYASTAHCYHRFMNDNQKAMHFIEKIKAMGADENPRFKRLIDTVTAAAEAEKPAADKPAEDKPAEDKPAEDKPTEDKPTEDKPTEDKPTADKPAADKPAKEKSTK